MRGVMLSPRDLHGSHVSIVPRHAVIDLAANRTDDAHFRQSLMFLMYSNSKTAFMGMKPHSL